MHIKVKTDTCERRELHQKLKNKIKGFNNSVIKQIDDQV